MGAPGAVCAVAMVLLLAACSLAASTGRPPASASAAAAASAPASGSGSPGARPTVPATAYRASVHRIGPALKARMRFAHRAGCPVPWRDLRYLRVTYVDFDGRAHQGELVVHRAAAAAMTDVFEALYDARWPIRAMRLVDDFRGDDDASMAADNTSGYNCRRVAGRSSWSAHAFGTAVDVNPVENPYVTAGAIRPPAGHRFAALDRSAGARVPAGTIREGDVVVRAFARIGWEWGGGWSTSKDYQHFSATGR